MAGPVRGQPEKPAKGYEYNIYNECGHLEDYYLKTDEPDLGAKLLPMMEKIWKNREKVSSELRAALPRYLKQVSDMGKFFRGWVTEQLPGIELGPEPKDWLGYLPELYPELASIVKKAK